MGQFTYDGLHLGLNPVKAKQGFLKIPNILEDNRKCRWGEFTYNKFHVGWKMGYVT